MVEYSMTNPQHGQTIRQTKNPNQHERKRQQIVRDSFLASYFMNLSIKYVKINACPFLHLSKLGLNFGYLRPKGIFNKAVVMK